MIFKFTRQIRDVFLSGAKEFYISLSDHLLTNLSLNNSYLANLRFLNPELRNIESEKRIVKCAKKLPPGAKIGHIQLDIFTLEWKNPVLESIPKSWFIDENKNYLPIDKYWSQIMKIKDQINDPKYPMISRVVKCCLAL